MNIMQPFINRLGRLVQKKNKMVCGSNKYLTTWNAIGTIDLYNTPTANCDIKLQPIIAHSFWHGHIGRKQLFSLKSFLCTQHMDSFEIWLWMDKESIEINRGNKDLEELVALSNKKIHIKEWDVFAEIKDTKLSSISWYFKWNRPLPFVADDFRIISLHKWGGIYFDLDVMFCRDFQPLLMRGEFTYAWEKQPFANSAILFIHKKSYLSDVIVSLVRRKLSSQPWIVFRYEYKSLRKMTIYPCTMFDPLWNGYCDGMPIKEFSDFFKKFDSDFRKSPSINSYKDFFPGIYAYHWHNKWTCPEYEDSYFGIFEKEFDEKLRDVTLTSQ